MNFQEWTIGKKLVAGIGLIVLLNVAMGSYALKGIRELSNTFSKEEVQNDLVNMVHSMRHLEKNFIMREEAKYVDEMMDLSERIDRKMEAGERILDFEAEKVLMNDMKKEKGVYIDSFRDYVTLHKKLVESRKGMVAAARSMEQEGVALRNDQKKQMESNFMRLRVEKSDDANRLVKYVEELRIAEKNYMLRHDERYVEEMKHLFREVEKLIEITRAKMKKAHNIDQMNGMLAAVKEYRKQFNKNHDINLEKQKKLDLMLVSAGNLIKKAENAGKISREQMESAESATVNSLIFIIIAVLLISFVVAVVIKKNIGKGLERTVEHVLDIVENIRIGRTEVRGNPYEVSVDFRGVIEGTNTLIDAFVKPMNVMIEQIARISNGDIPEIISEDYRGNFGEIKESINDCVLLVENLIRETGGLIENVQSGKLDSRCGTGDFKGEWKNLTANVNKLVETFVEHLDSVPAPIMLIDKNFDINFMNRAGCEVVGSSRTQLLGSKCYNHFKTSDCQTSNCACSRAMANGQKNTSETDANPSGMKIDISYTGAPVKNSTGDIVGAIEIVVDQTEIKKAQRVADKVSRYQSEEVDKLSKTLEKMSEGDLTVSYTAADGEGDTEDVSRNFAMISENLNNTVVSMNSILLQVNGAVEQVAAGAFQVSGASQSLSEGATEQASSLEEISSSMQEIGSQIRVNAENAEKCDSLSKEAMESAKTGSEQMEILLEAMDDIDKSSKNISKIIKVIDEIAFQTNVLALNAAVEAARAGEHGRGFAVVAEEVRELAQKSAKAAKETTEMIDDSIKKAENGSNISAETSSVLKQLVEASKSVGAIVEEISIASNEQAQGVLQINTGLSQIEQVTQQNTANAEESAAASEELSGQADELRKMISRFKLSEGEETSEEVAETIHR